MIKSRMSKITFLIFAIMLINMGFKTYVKSQPINKSESVYVTLDSQGNVKQQTVSDWLYSNGPLKNIIDKSNLKNITNVKSDDKPVVSGENIIWNSKNSSIFYNGKTNKKLPISFSMRYYFNGNEVNPKDIIGKSGKLEIYINVKNNDKHIVKINNSNREIYTPFITTIAVPFNMDKFKNVTVDGGQLLSEGNNIIAVFATVPGLKESFQFKNNIIGTKENFVINADVKSFSMASAIMLIAPTNFKANNIKQIKTDGIEQLINGTSELEKNSKKIVESSKTLLTGEKQVETNLDKIRFGSYKLGLGTEEISKGTSNLIEGTCKLKEGYKKAADGTEKLCVSTEKLSDGINKYCKGAKEFSSGALKYSLGCELINYKFKKVTQSNKSMEKNVNEMVSLYEGINNKQKQQDKDIEEISKAIQQLKKSNVSISNEKIKSIGSKVDKLKANSKLLTHQTEELRARQDMTSYESKQICKEQEILKPKINELVKGSIKLKLGAAKLQKGTMDIATGSNKLKNGSKKLKGVSIDIENGFDKIINGEDTLAFSLLKVNYGAQNLLDGAKKLQKGQNQIVKGSEQLTKGMNTFHKEGIVKLNNKIKDGFKDLNSVLESKNKVLELSNSYKSFTGIANNTKGEVKFIMKTEEIK